MTEEKLKEVADKVRDLKNWIAVFAEEYKLPEEAVKKLHEKIDEVGTSLSGLV